MLLKVLYLANLLLYISRISRLHTPTHIALTSFLLLLTCILEEQNQALRLTRWGLNWLKSLPSRLQISSDTETTAQNTKVAEHDIIIPTPSCPLSACCLVKTNWLLIPPTGDRFTQTLGLSFSEWNHLLWGLQRRYWTGLIPRQGCGKKGGNNSRASALYQKPKQGLLVDLQRLLAFFKCGPSQFHLAAFTWGSCDDQREIDTGNCFP